MIWLVLVDEAMAVAEDGGGQGGRHALQVEDALVGGRFSSGDAAQPPITNSSVLYAREVTSHGFKQVLSSTTPGGSVAGTSLAEYLSHPAK